MRSALYRSIDVWRREPGGELVRYRCFEILTGGGFCVQSKDGYRLGTGSRYIEDLDQQFLELLVEESPESRSGIFPTLEAAIEAFDRSFLEDDSP